MKTFIKITLLLFLFYCFSLHAQKYQDPELSALKEWASLTDLLQKEAAYFQGKSGRIRLQSSNFTDFTIQQLSITEEKITLALYLTNRFFRKTFKEQKQIYNYTFEEFDFRFKSLAIDYGNQWYFDDFPETVWLQLEFFDKVIHQETSIQEKACESKVWVTKPIEKIQTSTFLFPMRSKNRATIFKAIDRFQSTVLKNELQDQTNH